MGYSRWHASPGTILFLCCATLAVAQSPIKNDVRYPDYERLNSLCHGYKAVEGGRERYGVVAHLQAEGELCNIYGYDVNELILKVTYETADRLHVVIQDPDDRAYQVPESVLPRPDDNHVAPEQSILRVRHTSSPFSFSVFRSDTGEVLFDSSAAPLVFENQYIRLRTYLPDDPYLYGLGEHTDPFRLKRTNYTRTLWNRDAGATPEGTNLYGSHPFYMEQRESGAHGVFLLNSNGMDIFMDKDEHGKQYLEYNILGGVLDFYFVAGPKPVDVVQQYGEIVGTPAMQPYWSLGFHQCRYGYQDAFAVAEVVQNYSRANIPLETMWTDIDYMDRRRMFTLDPERFPRKQMRELVDHLHDHDQHYIMMVDPAIAWVFKPTRDHRYMPLRRGLQKHAFLRRTNGSVWLGVVWPGPTVFPDWFAPGALKFWKGEFKRFFGRKKGIEIDGLWIDMNEPSSLFCPFPCDDPFGAAEKAGAPPPAPAVRNPPRPLPGWPCSFQPDWTAPSECYETAKHGKKDKRAMDVERFGYEDEADFFEDDDIYPLNIDDEAEFLRAVDKDQLAGVPDDDIAGNSSETVDLDRRMIDLTRHKFWQDSRRMGFPHRDLLYPKYAIHNKAAWIDAWNADYGGLSNYTVNTNLTHRNGLSMYDTHNLYGMMMGMASRKAMMARGHHQNKRPLVISRSTFAGAGAHIGHWLGDNLSTWWHYRASIRSMLAFTSLFQFSMVGSDVCGFGANTTEELCARWATLGAFQPFYRNHNDFAMKSQEFYLWESVAEGARRAIDIRYRLMDYIYTSMWHASKDGLPTLFPMFYLYPNDTTTWDLELQYFFGPAILVAPVTEENSTSVDVYLPDDLFYDFHTHEPIRGNAEMHTFENQNLTDIPLLIRSGTIIPMRSQSAMTTKVLREQTFDLLIPLDDDMKASGELYLDDGVSLDTVYTHVLFWYQDGVLTIDGTFEYDAGVGIRRVTILGSGNVKDMEKEEEDEGVDDLNDELRRSKSKRLDSARVVDEEHEHLMNTLMGKSKHSVSYEVNLPLNKASNLIVSTNKIDTLMEGSED